MALVGVLALFLFVPNSAIGALIIIDNMTVFQGSSASPALEDCTVAGGPETDGVAGGAANLVGGARMLEITHSVSDTACTRAYVNGGTPSGWAVANDPNATGWGRAVWGGSSTLIANHGLTLDLTNIDYFNFTYVKADHPTTFTLRVYNSAAQGSQATISMDGVADKTNHHVLKAAFAAIGGLTAVDWSANISRITLRFDQVEDIDVVVREIQAITSENPDLTCTKEFDKSYAEPGDEITATVVITNTGDVSTEIKVVDVLDAGLTYKETVAPSPAAPVEAPAQTLTWASLGPLDPGDSLTLKYVITVVTIAQGDVLCNDVTAEALGWPGTVTNCYDCVSMVPQAPTFTQWGIIGFLLVLGAVAVLFMRRRSSVS